MHALLIFNQNNFLLLTPLHPATCHSWDHSNSKQQWSSQFQKDKIKSCICSSSRSRFTYLYNTTVTTGWNDSKGHFDSFKSLNESDKQLTLTLCFAAVQSRKTGPDILEVVIASLIFVWHSKIIQMYCQVNSSVAGEEHEVGNEVIRNEQFIEKP